MFIKDKKAQADAVFEVLIAVILMSFVFLVGSFSMQSLAKTKCSKEINIALSDLARNISLVATNPLASKQYFFNMPNCFGPNYNVKIIESQGSLCASYCSGASNKCFLLQYDNNKDKVSPIRYKCINISPMTMLNPLVYCSTLQNGFEIIQKDNSISLKKGKYLITSNSLNMPILCIYKKSDK